MFQLGCRMPILIRSHETHELTLMKERENANLAKAFGINSSHREGEAFNREIQAAKAEGYRAEKERNAQDYAARTAARVELEMQKKKMEVENKLKEFQEGRARSATVRETVPVRREPERVSEV